MRWTCIQTASVVGTRARELSTAQRLALEDHLGGCVACRETAQLGSAFRKMLDAQHAGGSGSIDRTITRALREAKAAPPSPRSAPRSMPRIALVGAIVVAGVAFAASRHERSAGTPPPIPVLESATEQPSVDSPPTAVVEEPAPVVEEPAPVVEEPAPVVEKPAPVVEKPAPSQPSAAEHLALAQSYLASRDIVDARKEIAAALAARPTRAERATAAVLDADASFVEGNTKVAIERYLAANEQYGDLLAGENALFAAARLQKKIGPASAARALFERYLSRYPNGEFSGEAKNRLR